MESELDKIDLGKLTPADVASIVAGMAGGLDEAAALLFRPGGVDRLIGPDVDSVGQLDELLRLAGAAEALHAAAMRVAHFYRVAKQQPKGADE